MSMLVLYATGHPRQYDSDEEEIAANNGENATRGGGLALGDPENPALHWWPSTTDFLTEARRHARRPVGVGNFEAFRRAIEHQHDLETVLFFGHANDNLLKFGDNEYIRGGDLRGHNYDLSAHFAPNGRIILYACNAARAEFLSALADSLRVTVCGFRGGVRWTLHWDGESPRRRITWRGIFRNNDSDPLPTNFVCASPNPADTGATGPHGLLLPGQMRLEGPPRSPVRIPGPIGVA